MRQPAFRTDYRVKSYFTADILDSTLPTNAGGTTIENLVCSIEVPPPVFPGEIWYMCYDVSVENPDHATAGTFLRAEVWITELPGASQVGINPILLDQTGSYNLGDQAGGRLQSFGDGDHKWSAASFVAHYAKLFLAVNTTPVDLADNIVHCATLGLLREIPRGGV